MKRLLIFFVFATILASFPAAAFQEIGWRDLTVPIDPEDDPYFGLTFDQRRNAETIIEIDRKRERGDAIGEADRAAEAAATNALAKEGLSAQEILRKNTLFLQKLKLQRTTVRNERANQQVRIPGYVIPLEIDGMDVTEFLLVPYAGACIHTPPPPANQIIHVKPNDSFRFRGLFTPVWVSGRLTVKSSRQNVGLSDGTSTFEVGYLLTASRVEHYTR